MKQGLDVLVILILGRPRNWCFRTNILGPRPKILKNRYPRTSSSPSYFWCEKSSFSSRPAEAWFQVKISKLKCKIKVSIWNYKTAKLGGSTIGRMTIFSGIIIIKYTPKMTKMATGGAREVNSKKGQHSALNNLIGFIFHLRVWKSVVSEIQKTIFKKVPLKKKVTSVKH